MRNLFKSAGVFLLLVLPLVCSAAVSERTYGPTSQYDHLWRIALKTRPNHQVTVQQMVVALFQTNPQAFEADNVNALRRGAILRIPSLTEVQHISQEKALKKIAHQNNTWPLDKANIMLAETNKLAMNAPTTAASAEPMGQADDVAIFDADQQVLANMQDGNPRVTALGMQLNREIQHARRIEKRFHKQIAHLEQSELALNGELLRVNSELASLTREVESVSRGSAARIEAPAATQSQDAHGVAVGADSSQPFWPMLKQYLVMDIGLMQQRMSPAGFVFAVGFLGFVLISLFSMLSYTMMRPGAARRGALSEEQPDNLVMATAAAAPSDADVDAGDFESDYDFMGSEEGIPTKFDLARAYIDMGDKPAAVRVLEEVAAQGDAHQKREAQAILKKIR